MATIDQAVAEFFAAGDGVVPCGVLLGDLSRGQIRAQVAAKRWQVPAHGAVVCHNGALTRRQQLRLALCIAPPGSALAGLTALEVDGLNGFERDVVHVQIPVGSRRPTADWIASRWSRHLGDEDVHPLRDPRRTRPARSLLDAASTARDDRTARSIILAGAQQRLVRASDLLAAIPRRGPCARRAVLVESIHDAAGGLQSVPETDFNLIIVRQRLPRPTRQRLVQTKAGRYYLDADWEKWAVGAEVHGAHHRELIQWDADLRRHNQLTVQGRRMLHFSSFSIRHEADQVGATLAAILC